MTTQPTSLNLDSKLTAAGPTATAFQQMWETLWQQSILPPALLELCRLRLAQLHRAEEELTVHNAAADLSPAKAAVLLEGDYTRDARFTPAELAVLEFTEVYAQDLSAISDEQAAAVKKHFGDKGLIVLVKALGFIDGRIRMARLWDHLSASAA